MASTDPSTKTDSYAEALRELTRRHEQVLEALAILRQMDEIDDPAESIDVVCRRILETIAFGLACANCSLMLLDEPREFLELRAACSPMEEEARSFAPGVWGGKRFRIGEGVVGRVCESGAPIRIDDVTEDPNFLPIRESQAEVGSLLCFPLRVGGQTIGVLNLSHPEPGFFSVESENTLTLIAERAARIFTSHLLRERLRESEAHYRLVAENAGDGILVSDKHGRVVSANPAIEGISGIRADRYITGEVAWESGIHPEDREKFAESRRTLSTAEESSFVEYRYIDAAGEVHHLEEHSARLLDASRNVTGAVTVARDISERKRAEEERRELEARVQHAQKLESLGILAGGIAHDFNNLLVGILGNASLGLNKTSAASPARQYFEKIEATTRRAAALTNQMLAYSGKGRL